MLTVRLLSLHADALALAADRTGDLAGTLPGNLMGSLTAGLLTGWAIAIPVGAVGALLVATSARHSLRVGVAGALGVAAVDGAYAALAVVGGVAAARVLEPVTEPLRLMAAVVMFALALSMLRSALKARSADGPGEGPETPVALETRVTPWRTFALFVAITAVNPATVVFFAAVVLSHRGVLGGATEGVAFVSAAFVASASWQLLLAAAGAGLGRWLTGPRGRLWTGVVSALVIAGFAVLALGL